MNKTPSDACDICGEESDYYHANVEKNLCQLCASGKRLYGEKPDAAAKPASPGIYFVNLANWRGVYSDPGSLKSFLIGYRYEISDWELVRYESGETIDFIGSDEIEWWYGTRSYVAVLGPQVFPPKS